MSSYISLLIEADIRESSSPTSSDTVASAASEARRLGVDPVMAIRDRIAELERDTVLSSASLSSGVTVPNHT